MSGADGAFGFGEVPMGSLTLSVQARRGAAFLVLASGPGSDGNGGDDDGEGEDDADDDLEDEDEDEIEDGEDLDRADDLRLHRAENTERIHVRVRIQDGQVCEMSMSRSGHEEREAELRMTRTAGNDDPDMEGKLELESRDDRERFKVRVEQATPDRVLEVVVIDLQGTEESQGTRTAQLGGEARWTIDTSNGGRLPFGVSSVEDLEGYGVEVRDFDTEVVLLTASAPELPATTSADDGGSGGEETRLRARARLRAQEPGLEGYVEVRSRPEDGEERFQMEAEHLAPGRRVDFEIETGEQTGQFTRMRTMTANAAGDTELEINTRHGDTLPNDAEGVRDLVRLRTQVRDADSGAVLLSGTVPALVAER